MEEIWKDIPGFEGYYKVSNIGNIMSVKRLVNSSITNKRLVNERVRKININKYGYQYITLHKKGKGTHFTIHRLVAMCFIPNSNNYSSINHMDEDKLNNNFENLEWCTTKYNNFYNNRQEKINIKLREYGKVIGTSISQYTLDGILVNKYNSLREMQRLTRFSRSSVKNCCIELRENYNGYTWKYS